MAKSGNLYLKEDERRTEEQDVYVNIEEAQAGDFWVGCRWKRCMG